jgi:hypothetical protein
MENEKNVYGKYKCVCCGYYTLNISPTNTFQICPICFWEDDGVQYNDSNYEGGANNVSLNQARKNFEEFGAVEQNLKKYVRLPKDEEK